MPLIKNKLLEVPIIQGGMGIGVSLGNLAGHVAACGGMGVVSAANTGFDEPDFWTDACSANARAVFREVTKAKKIAGGKGLVAINAMVATKYVAESVAAAIKAGVDAIISGAGLPTKLPAMVKGTDVAIAPIVSSGKAANTICRLWDKHHGVTPNFLVIEGSEAGGHLGFLRDDLLHGTAQTLSSILADVLEVLRPFKKKYDRDIPVFVAGGVYSGEDMAKYTKQGAAGAQIATRFITTYECDASMAYKQAYLNAKKEDIQVVVSPVGMPGRALRSPLIEKLESGRIPPKRCARCLHPCDPAATPYCITKALVEAMKGNWEEGLFFCGSNAWRMDKLMHVSTLMEEIMNDWRAFA